MLTIATLLKDNQHYLNIHYFCFFTQNQPATTITLPTKKYQLVSITYSHAENQKLKL